MYQENHHNGNIPQRVNLGLVEIGNQIREVCGYQVDTIGRTSYFDAVVDGSVVVLSRTLTLENPNPDTMYVGTLDSRKFISTRNALMNFEALHEKRNKKMV